MKQHAGEEVLVLKPNTYWLTRVIIIRWCCLIYFVAFGVALYQNRALLGSDGLLPACPYFERLAAHHGFDPGATNWFFNTTAPTTVSAQEHWNRFHAVPSIMWWTGCSDTVLDGVAIAGLILSALAFLQGAGNVFIFTILWLLYHTLVTIGQRWYSFGWESQLLECGFLMIFLVPLVSITPLPRGSPTPTVVLWAHRWLIFRIMIGAGLIKLRGDACWRDLTCMAFHYETQPVPNPVSWWLHSLPMWFHKLGTLTNHFVELVAPFMLLLSRRWRILGGLIQIGFQVTIIVSGNLSFLNHLTILPCLACFDDASLGVLFPASTRAKVVALQQSCDKSSREEGADRAASSPSSGSEEEQDETTTTAAAAAAVATEADQHSPAMHLRRRGRRRGDGQSSAAGSRQAASVPQPAGVADADVSSWRRMWSRGLRSVRVVVSIGLLVLIAWLSTPVVLNLMSSRQAMNTSFDSLRLVNTYGAFGSITKTRTEVVLQASLVDDPGEEDWVEYEFPCKPGRVDRRPCVITPYHYRMDWLMWFAAFQNYGQNPWLVHMVAKILVGDDTVFPFFVHNPFPDASKPPKVVRLMHYKYEFEYGSNSTAWWRREALGEYLPALNRGNPSLRQFAKHQGWKVAGKLY